MHLLVLALLAAGAGADLDSVEHARLHDVMAEFRDDPGDFSRIFAGVFLQAVPPPQLTATFADFHHRLGTATEARRLSPGKWEVDFSGGYTVQVTLVVDPGSGLLTGLRLGPPAPRGKSLEKLVADLGKLPGKVSVRVEQLGPEHKRVAGLHDEDELAIGSTFKLYVLGELTRQIKEGRHRWDEVVLLDERSRSWPSGELHTWPTGTPITVQTLATMMISRSDNTATDRLLELVGREKVEAVQTALGHAHPDRNRPFLTTAEMFRIKEQDGVLARRYLAATVAARRAMLEEVDAQPRRQPSLSGAAPAWIDRIEWFASAQDLCSAMAHLSEAGPTVAGILAVNPGTSLGDRFTYVGHKGGSESGVLDLTWLVRTRKGSTYAVSLGWNDTEKPVDEGKLAGIGEGILAALADR